ncbi:lysozyme inhibitor LprI family protein [Clostridium sp. LP20]|uniref:lysozyme inhibitor LprI family protein n=1 Tax=Clostridium sp. LP20 TaxID=3418665 RepID=UPI003EE661A1
MKKIILFILGVLLCLVLVACGDKDVSNKGEEDKTKIENNQIEESSKNKNEKLKEDKEIKNVSKKHTYKEKLDNIQVGLVDLKDLYAGNTIEMKAAVSEEWSRWDKALNEIYGVLKEDLSKEEMSKLENEEVKWISDRDKKAKEASLKYEGGTFEQVEYTGALAKTTKERCYELVEKYMK